MNYFHCIVGNSGNAVTLTVTCDSEFAGQTISCSDGTTTLTKTCPSNSPYTVKFAIPNSGTWTVSSGTDSVSVVIVEETELHFVPTGSTATPTDDIQTWLHCASIWDKDYTTISAVLADTTTLLALISSNNAADYMARSTSWASSVCANSTAMTYIGNNDYCANKLLANSTWLTAICNSAYFESVLNVKVPTMTSNTTPSGECFRQSGNVVTEVYKAFDGDDDTTYLPYNYTLASYGSYAGYRFAQAMSAKKARVVFVETYAANRSDFHFKIQGYVNNAWVDISDAKTISLVRSTKNVQNVVLNNSNKITDYRVICDTLHATGQFVTELGTLQLYGRT